MGKQREKGEAKAMLIGLSTDTHTRTYARNTQRKGKSTINKSRRTRALIAPKV